MGDGKIPFTDPTAPCTSATGIVDTPEIGDVPLPFKYPVKLVVPVPPFATGTVGRVVLSTTKLEPPTSNPAPNERSIVADERPFEPLICFIADIFASFAFVMARGATTGRSAVPLRSPASFTLPFTVVVASGVPFNRTALSTYVLFETSNGLAGANG